jgi:hypothetical protein
MVDFLKSRFRSSSSKKPLMIALRKIMLTSVMFKDNVTVRISC